MQNKSRTVGVIGFGVIGSSMARNLARKGYTVFGCSRSSSKVRALADEGIIAMESPEKLAHETSTVITSVTDGKALHDVLWGSGQLLAHLPPSSLIIDTTTVSPSEALEASSRCNALSVDFCDAPVTGGDIGARNATLTIMCGGTREVITKARAFLECLGSKIVHVGPVGAGQRTKAANQIAIALGIVAMTEALHFARTQGLDVSTTLDILQGGSAGSWALSNYGPRLIKGDLSPGFDAAHMLKDIRIALSESSNVCNLPGAAIAAELFEQLVTNHPGLGNHALIESYASFPREGTRLCPGDQ